MVGHNTTTLGQMKAELFITNSSKEEGDARQRHTVGRGLDMGTG